MLTNKFPMPKKTANASADYNEFNCRIGKQYPKCVPGELCNPEYLIDTVNQCLTCKKIKSC